MDVSKSTNKEWAKEIAKIYLTDGTSFGYDIVNELQRQADDPLTKAIGEYLDEEKVVLTEVGHIAATTSELIVQHVTEGLKEGWSPSDIQQALLDSGVFGEPRALMLSRTITGNAANLGQWIGASQTGATHKSWLNSGFEVRETHVAVNNVTIPIDETFEVGGHSARYPLDNNLPPEERINCRCTLTYSIE